jgi:hypothetical protein
MIDQVTSVLRWRLRMAGLAGRKELFGDLGLPLQEGKPQRPIHRHDRLAPLQPLLHHRDHVPVGPLTALASCRVGPGWPRHEQV